MYVCCMYVCIIIIIITIIIIIIIIMIMIMIMITETAVAAGGAAEIAATRKHAKYSELERRYTVVPVAVETFGLSTERASPS